jgi:hypothetical protein
VLPDPAWADAFTGTLRHVFTPDVLDTDGTVLQRRRSTVADVVYADEALLT